MNKAFEKILEMLEEKLRKSEERYYRYLDDSNLSCMFDRSDIEEKRVDTIKEMIEIVHEVAEEYKGGWIPCSERLPKEHQEVILQDFYGNITIEEMKISDGIEGFSYGDWWSSANNYVAWQPLPEPFKESD